MTLKKIAQIAGVSIKTASRAINDYPDIKKETKEKILSIAKEYHYIPNLAAKSLRQNRSFSIGLILPDLTNVFFGEVGVAIHNYFKHHGYSTLISFSEGKEKAEIESLDNLIAKQVDGIIMATVGNTGKHLQSILTRRKLPFVAIDNEVNDLRTNIVLHDNHYHAWILTCHLIEQGCSQIGFISGPLSETSGRQRYEGYLRAMDEAGLPTKKDQVTFGDWSIKSGRKTAKQLLQRTGRRLDAILIGNSLMALGVYTVLYELGLRIPHDIALASFDDLNIVESLVPPLTTMSKVDSKIGKLAARRLYTMIRNPEDRELQETLVKAELKPRQSSLKKGLDA